VLICLHALVLTLVVIPVIYSLVKGWRLPQTAMDGSALPAIR
jgi:hypothetical protein